MAEATHGHGVVADLLRSTVAEWIVTLGLVFGGCCSNAWALEVATSQNPHAGTLITFAQFVLVSMYGLWKHITVAPALTARKDVLRIVAAQIVHLHSRGTAAVDTSRSAAAERRVYVALEGRTAGAFADELAREIAVGSRALGVGRFSFAGDVREVAAQLDSLWGVPDDPPDSVVLVDAEAHLHAGEFCTRWDYSVFLVSAQDDGVQGPRGRASLTIDVSSQTHPVIVSPGRHPLTVLKSLSRIRLKERSIPISRWAVQVVLFLVTSLLNNAAFGYKVPMGVHIIFRSGGLVVNMLMGWLMDGRRYNATQILSVILVTLGVVCTTVSATQAPASPVESSAGQYYTGILILTLALIMSGFMGLAQDRAYAKYGRGHWQEAMFYLHFLALPGFGFVWRDVGRQIGTVNASERVDLETVARRLRLSSVLTRRGVWMPWFYVPLMVNVVTQLVCVSGVHRLTSRVNSLTVTLVLVVRKAVSLGISVMLVGGASEVLLWLGGALVVCGTIGYTVGAGTEKARNVKKRE